MQLDRTHVQIRLRTLSEIGDLAMVMIRRYPTALLIGFVLGALPWAIINLLLLGWLPLQEADYGLNDEDALMELARYGVWMMTLVVLQAPAAGVMTTYYLGQAVFEQQPTWTNVAKTIKQHFWRWFYVLGIRRLAVPAMVLLLFRIGSPVNGFFDVMVPIMFLVAIAVMRGARPFVPEIILLEQCPIQQVKPDVITMARRSKSLHKPMGSELSGRFLAVSFLLIWLFLSVLYSLIWARGIITNSWSWGLFTLMVLYPLALWSVAGLSVLIRFLSYLDTRIRLEGWEVELAVRAESMRQFGDEADLAAAPTQAAPPPQSPPPNVAATTTGASS